MYASTYQATTGHPKPGRHIGRVSEVIAHTEAGSDLPAAATIDQERQRLRAIDAYHRSLGWGGFGYSAMVCQSGRVHEGRGYHRSGAHTRGHNTTALAFVVPGHGDRTAMSDASIAGARAWIGEGVHGGALTRTPMISGHRDYANKSCPGNKIYPQLGQLRGVTGFEPQEDEMRPEQEARLHAKLDDLIAAIKTTHSKADGARKLGHQIKNLDPPSNLSEALRRLEEAEQAHAGGGRVRVIVEGPHEDA